MNALVRLLLSIGLLAIFAPRLTAQEAAPADASAGLAEDYSCMFCHGPAGTLAGDPENKHLIVTEHDLLADVHWQKGLRCHDCHGGAASVENFVAHRNDESFRPLGTPADIPDFCGHCHSDIEYMRRYDPSPRTDQLAEYLTSGHGMKLKAGDEKVATCVSCHGGHGILGVKDLQSPVYPTHLAETCSKCHSNAELMNGRQYHGRPLGHDQYEEWATSVHAKALLNGADLSSATCNDCHGNHGALPPEIGSVANACGTCHVKVAQLFSETRMKHQFEKLELPGCAACHGNHAIHSPSDAMLGMDTDAVCASCHREGKFGATIAGADEARKMRAKLEELKGAIAQAHSMIAHAERLGMEVRSPRFELRKADTALTNARALIHTFSPAPVEKSINEGLTVTQSVNERAQAAINEHGYRRVWLGISLVPILLVIVLLLAFIRRLPIPSQEATATR